MLLFELTESIWKTQGASFSLALDEIRHDIEQQATLMNVFITVVCREVTNSLAFLYSLRFL